MQTRVDANPYFTIPQRPDFLNDSFTLQLTRESKDLFELGTAGQGYIGLVDLETGDIHLVPSYNKNDGLLRLDKNGNPFIRYAESSQVLGTLTGDLHSQCTSLLKLGEKGGQAGKLMGFGIWKAGCGVKFLSSLPSSNALIPDECLLIKENNKWELVYVDDKRKTYPMSFDEFSELLSALTRLPDKKPEELTAQERKAVERLFHKKDEDEYDDEDENEFKLIKNRSSSQNFYAVKYAEIFADYFRLKVANQQAHTLNLKRELPLPVFQKIMDAVCEGLAIKPVDDLPHHPLVPKGVDNLRLHLQIQEDWIEDSAKCKKKLFKKLAKQGDVRRILSHFKINDADILKNVNNFNLLDEIIQRSPKLAYEICLTFKTLSQAGFFTIEDNFNFLLDVYRKLPNAFRKENKVYLYQFEVRKVFCSLVEHGIVDKDNFVDVVDQVGNLPQLEDIIDLLNDLNLSDNNLNKAIFFQLADHPKQIDDMAYALDGFRKIKAVSASNHFPEIAHLLLQNPSFTDEIFSFFRLLDKVSFLTVENISAVMILISDKVEFIEDLEAAMEVLNRIRQTKVEQNFALLNLLAVYPDAIIDVVAGLISLTDKKILPNDEYFDSIAKLFTLNRNKIILINLALETLNNCELLNKENMGLFIIKMQADVTYAERLTKAIIYSNPNLIKQKAKQFSQSEPSKTLDFLDRLINLDKPTRKQLTSSAQTLFGDSISNVVQSDSKIKLSQSN